MCEFQAINGGRTCVECILFPAVADGPGVCQPCIAVLEAQVLFAVDDWYDLSHSELLASKDDWKQILEKMDRAVQRLRMARAKNRKKNSANA